MKRTVGALGLGALLAGLAGGCVGNESAEQGTYWGIAEPTSMRVVVQNGEERTLRDRKYFEYFDDKGKHSLIFTEEKMPLGNRWKLIAVQGIQDEELYKILSEKLPRTASFLASPNRKLDCVQFEDLRNKDGQRTRIYLPGGSEDYIVSDIIREKQEEKR